MESSHLKRKSVNCLLFSFGNSTGCLKFKNALIKKGNMATVGSAIINKECMSFFCILKRVFNPKSIPGTALPSSGEVF